MICVAARLAASLDGQTSLGASALVDAVRDSSGVSISGAMIELTDVARGLRRSQTAEAHFCSPPVLRVSTTCRFQKRDLKPKRSASWCSKPAKGQATTSTFSPDRSLPRSA